MNSFHFNGPVPLNHPTAIIRKAALETIVDHIRSLSYPAIMSARQTGKTSLLNQLTSRYADRFAFVFLDFQGWRDVKLTALYALILRQLAVTLPNSSERLLAANPKNGPDFKEELIEAATACNKDRLVFVCDELGALNTDVANTFADIVRALFTDTRKREYRIVFVLAGGIDLARLATGVSSPLNNIVSPVHLDDFTIDDVKCIAAAGDLSAASDAVYALTAGHPYLTQRLLWYVSPESDDLSLDDAVNRLIDDGDPCIGTALRRIESSPDSVKSLARRIVEGNEVRFNRTTWQITELELAGLIRRGSKGTCIPRNEIMRRALRQISGPHYINVNCKILTRVVPTGCYHNLDSEKFPLLHVQIDNDTGSDAHVRIAAVIPDYSNPDVRVIRVASHDAADVTLMPRLNRDKIAGLNEITQASINVNVMRLDTGSTLHEEVSDIWLHARDTALLALIDPETSELVDDLSHHLCAWVTPRASGITDVLRNASDRHPKRRLTGYPREGEEDEKKASIRTQVQAIYETLQRNNKIDYLSSAISFGAQADQIIQRVQLPAQTLKGWSANCLDGAVLFASLLESIELNPVLVLMAGHAYVGWEVAPGSGEYEYLETTMLQDYPFDTAVRYAAETTSISQSNGDHKRRLFDREGFWHQIYVAEWRRRNIFPSE